VVAVLTLALRAIVHAEGPATARHPAWTAHVTSVDDALARDDVAGAVRAWNDAYLAALGSWRWDGVLDVGDAYLRIGRASGLGQAAVARARNLYLTALFRARQQDSLDGVLRVGEAFARLGDREVAEECAGLAQRLAVHRADPSGAARVHAFRARLAEAAVASQLGP
jgi:hypothetical protein